MPICRRVLVALALTWFAWSNPFDVSARQAPAPATPAPPSKATAPSGKDLVVERADTLVRFEGDGTRDLQVSMRVRVLTDAAVQQFAQVAYTYDAYQTKARFEHLEVQKPSGQLARAATDGVTDVSIQALPDVLTDSHQMRLAVPGLAPGDTIDYRIVERSTRALVPKHFWYQYRFTTGAVITSESLTIDVPADRMVEVKTATAREAAFTGSERIGDRRVYRWKRSNPEPQLMTTMIEKVLEGRLDPPDVQITTLRSWDELAAWYIEAVRDLDRPDAAISAKAEELTRGLSNPADKLRALYEFVATKCRYLSLSFGTGRLIPHPATEVLKNQYGDCKDRHTLLSALARAVGLRTYPALINSTQVLDPSLPSFAQFDHVITVGVLGPADGDWVWLDSSSGVAPFGLISATLRNKTALVLQTSDSQAGAGRSTGVARLVSTPAAPPFQCFYRTEVEARLTEMGTLDSRVAISLRGDAETTLRALLRTVPAEKHVEFLKGIAQGMQLTGELADASISDPTAARNPLILRFRVRRVDWFDRAKADSLVLPLERSLLPYADESDWQGKTVVKLGSAPTEVSASAAIELPAGYVPRLPVDIAITRDYGVYRSTHKLEGSRLTVRRELTTKTVELPSERMRDYLAFVAAIRADEAQKIRLDTTAAAPAPDLKEATPSELYTFGLAAFDRKDYKAAVEAWKQAVAVDPKHRQAWDAIGLAHIELEQWKEAVAALREQVKVEPFHDQAWGDLGWALQHVSEPKDAIAAYRKQIEIKPLDNYAHRRLGLLLLHGSPPDNKEAATELAKAEQITPDDREAIAGLGSALLKIGETRKALGAFERVAKLSPSPGLLSEMAYDLAEAGVELDRAIAWATESLHQAEADSLKLDLNKATGKDGRESWALSWAWHALGWAAYQKGDMATAERYLTAARSVRSSWEISNHLSIVREKMGRPKDAIRFAAESLAYQAEPVVSERLTRLAGSKGAAEQALEPARAGVLWERTASFARVSPKLGYLDIVVLFTNGSSRPEVRALSDDPDLLPLLDHIRKASFPVVFPDATPARVLSDGRLVCREKGGECVALLYFGWRLPAAPRTDSGR
jgi:tetratricopeptide (TPR) repeat protein